MRLRLLCVAVLLATAGVPFVAGSASAAALLSDDFTDGDAAGWSMSGGAWSVSGGAYRLPSGPPPPTASPTGPPSGSADGFASVAALGLSGTTGGAGGPTIQGTIFEAAMAPQSGASIVAMQHKLDPPLVTLMVGIGIPLSFLTLPVWWYVLQGV